jgi:D-alanyl-D-alanine carboxypeptidase/D-alanyl-D-alanine-endopeptidase (penicillin-binding protein 4)
MRIRSFACIALAALAVVGCSHQTSMTSVRAAGTSAAAEGSLAPLLRGVLHKRDDSGAVVSARVVDLKTGRELYAENLDRPTIPASNMKLFTTAAALDRFGPEHTFDTYLAKDGEDLWVIGTGDPSLGDAKVAKRRGEAQLAVFDRWVAALKAKGVTEVKGKLIYYDGAFDAQTVHPSWSRGYSTDWYAAPVTGLNLNDNCIDVTVTPGKEGEPVTYEVMPPVTNITITNEMKTGAKGVSEPLDRKDQSMHWYLTGGVSEKKTLQSKCVPDPGAFFADALRTHLEKAGIKVAGATERAEKPLGGKLVPPAEKVLVVERSPMPPVIDRLNKDSQNLFAEAFSKALGRQWNLDRGNDVPGSWESGSDAIHGFLAKHKIDGKGLVFADGSGLSRQNRVTARGVSDLLVAMHKHPYAKTFVDSLPVGGVDGTIGKRQKDIAGKIKAKTGYIGGVRSLSGYAEAADGRTLVFTFIYNQIPGSVAPFENLQDDACRLLVAYPNPERAKLSPSTRPTTRP